MMTASPAPGLLDWALDKLPEDQRIIVDSRIKGHGWADIALELGRKRPNVLRSYKRAMCALKAHLDLAQEVLEAVGEER